MQRYGFEVVGMTLTPLAITKTLEILSSGLFAGGAVMQTVVDHPARSRADHAAALGQMQRTLVAADPYMPILALAGAAGGAGALVMAGGPADLAVAVTMVLIVVFTVVAIAPLNKAMHAMPLVSCEEPLVRSAMKRWGALHGVRSVLGVVAFFIAAL